MNPQKYLTQVLVSVPQVAKGELERWLPNRWKARDQERERAAAG